MGNYVKRLFNYYFSVVLILTPTYSIGSNNKSSSQYPLVFDGAINPDIKELAKIKSPAKVLPDDNSLEEWNAYLQKNFLRASNIDHQDLSNMQQTPLYTKMKPYFQELAMLDSIYPPKIKYDEVVVFGGTPLHTKARFDFLKQNIRNGDVEFPENIRVTYINGERKIQESEKKEAQDMGIECEYQHECAQKVWNAYFSDLPVKFEMMTLKPPPGRRANTEDTLKEYINTLPVKEGGTSILLYSNQPYGPYQSDTALAQKYILQRNDLLFYVAAEKSERDDTEVTLTDSIARRVYTELQKNKTKL